jgi:hypothetical protein
MQQLLREFNAYKPGSVGSLKSIDNIAQMAEMLRPEIRGMFCGIYLLPILAFCYDHIFCIVYIYLLKLTWNY